MTHVTGEHFTGDSPYVVVEVDHVNTHEKLRRTKFQTKAVKGLDPVWNETHELDPWHAGEPIKFSVYDKALVGSKTEGVVTLPSEAFYPSGFQGPLTFANKEQSELYVNIVPVGPSVRDLQLEVTIIQANNLKHLMHFTGDAPYVVAQVDHKKSKSEIAKHQTQVAKNAPNPLNPVFNETFMLGPWNWDEALEFVVYDKGLLNAKGEGKATIEAKHFYPLGFEGIVPLDTNPEATVMVRIVPAGRWSRNARRKRSATQTGYPAQEGAQLPAQPPATSTSLMSTPPSANWRTIGSRSSRQTGSAVTSPEASHAAFSPAGAQHRSVSPRPLEPPVGRQPALQQTPLSQSMESSRNYGPAPIILSSRFPASRTCSGSMAFAMRLPDTSSQGSPQALPLNARPVDPRATLSAAGRNNDGMVTKAEFLALLQGLPGGRL